MGPHRPPVDRHAADAADQARIRGAFQSLSGDGDEPAPEGQAAHEQGEDALLDELAQIIGRAQEIIAQLRQGQAAVEGAAPADSGVEVEGQPPGGALP